MSRAICMCFVTAMQFQSELEIHLIIVILGYMDGYCWSPAPGIITMFMEVCSHGPIRLLGLKLKVARLYIQRGVQPLKPFLQRHQKTNVMVKWVQCTIIIVFILKYEVLPGWGTFAQICTSIKQCVCMLVCVCVRARACACLRVCMRAYAVCVYVCVCVCARVYACVYHVCVYMCLSSPSSLVQVFIGKLSKCRWSLGSLKMIGGSWTNKCCMTLIGVHSNMLLNVIYYVLCVCLCVNTCMYVSMHVCECVGRGKLKFGQHGV